MTWRWFFYRLCNPFATMIWLDISLTCSIHFIKINVRDNWSIDWLTENGWLLGHICVLKVLLWILTTYKLINDYKYIYIHSRKHIEIMMFWPNIFDWIEAVYVLSHTWVHNNNNKKHTETQKHQISHHAFNTIMEINRLFVSNNGFER